MQNGLDLEEPCASRPASGGRLASGAPVADTLEFLQAFPADLVMGPRANPQTVSQQRYVRAALEAGRHVVTANKGRLRSPTAICAPWPPAERRLYFESTVMDGAPVLACARGAVARR